MLCGTSNSLVLHLSKLEGSDYGISPKIFKVKRIKQK